MTARLPGGEVVLLFAATIVVSAFLPFLPGGILGRIAAQQLLAVAGSALVVMRLAGLSWREVAGTASPELRVWLGTVAGTLGGALLQAPLLDFWAAAIGASPPAWWHDATRGEAARDVLLMAVGLVVIPPLAEELFFRGVFQVRAAAFGRAASLVGPSVVFAVYHMDPYGFPVQLASAVALGLLRERAGGLYAPIAAHALNNALGVAELARGEGPLLEARLALPLGAVLLAAGVWLLWRRKAP